MIASEQINTSRIDQAFCLKNDEWVELDVCSQEYALWLTSR